MKDPLVEALFVISLLNICFNIVITIFLCFLFLSIKKNNKGGQE